MHKKYVSLIFTIFFLALFAIYAAYNSDTIREVFKVGAIGLVLIALGRLGVYLNNGYFIKWTTEAFVKKIPTGESIYIGILSAIGNFFGPLLGGASIRAIYLKKSYALSYSSFTSTLFGYYLILFLVTSCFAVASLLMLAKSSQVLLLLVFFTTILIVLLLLTFSKLPESGRLINQRKNPKLIKRMVGTLYKIEDGWKTIKHKSKLISRLVLLATLSFLTQFFISYVEFNALQIDYNIQTLILYTAFMVVSLLISITPGAIGIRETLLFIFASTMALTNEQIIQLAVIDRGVTFILLLALFLVTRSNKLKELMIGRKVSI